MKQSSELPFFQFSLILRSIRQLSKFIAFAKNKLWRNVAKTVNNQTCCNTKNQSAANLINICNNLVEKDAKTGRQARSPLNKLH